MAKALRRAGATVRNVSVAGRFTSRAPRLLRTLHPFRCRRGAGRLSRACRRAGGAPRQRPPADSGALRCVRVVVRECRGPRSRATGRHRGKAVLAGGPRCLPFCDSDDPRYRHACDDSSPTRLAFRGVDCGAVWVGADDDVIKPGSDVPTIPCSGCSCTRASYRCTGWSTWCAPRTSSSSTTTASASRSSVRGTRKRASGELARELDVRNCSSSVAAPTKSSPA